MAHKNKIGLQHVGKSFIIENFRVVIDKLLDEGGFSFVYQVHAQDGHEYALKKITTNTKEEFEVYLQEINIMRSLTLNEASNCVRLVAAQSYSGTISPGNYIVGGAGVHELYLLMELCTSSVHTLMTSKLPIHLTEQMVFDIFYSTCVALLQLHSMETPIIHRDIKIENILINSRGHYVLCDFGSAFIGTIHPNMDNRNEIEEEINKYTTMDYRSPEMVNLYSGYEINTKADIWAMGILLFKLCFRKTPWGDSKFGILSGKLFIPSSPIYSKNIHNLIHILLNPNPLVRPDIHQVLNATCKFLRKPPPPGLKLDGKEEIDIRASPDTTRSAKQVTSSSTATGTTQSTAGKHKQTYQDTPIITSVKARSRPMANKATPHSIPKILTPPPSSQTSPSKRSYTQPQGIKKQTKVKSNLLTPFNICDVDDLDQFGMSQFCPSIKSISAQNLRDTTDMFGLEPFSASIGQKSGSKKDLFGAVPFNEIIMHQKVKRNDSFDIGVFSTNASGTNTRVSN